MGIAFKDLIIFEEIEISSLTGKKLAVDAHNTIFQFLTTIRAADGTPLKDSKGNVTSHLVGLFSRTAKLMQSGLKLAFVFDGKAPDLKQKTREQRSALKDAAFEKYKEAAKREDVDEMRKYAAQSVRLTPEIIEESKQLLSLLGIPIVQAPSEAEAQAAFMASSGAVFAAVSQDYDSLVNGAPKLIRNLSISGKRKKANKLSYEAAKPEMIDLALNLNNLGIDRSQLIALGMLVGTDYNPGGIKGIGPKNALKLVKKHGTDFEALFKEAKWGESFEFGWNEVFYLIKNIPVTEDYSLQWKGADIEGVKEMLLKKDFSEQRINLELENLAKNTEKKSQKGLSEFF